MAKNFKASMGIESLISENKTEEIKAKAGRPLGSGKPENQNKILKNWKVDSDIVNEIKMIASKEGYRITMETGVPTKIAEQGVVEIALREYIAKYNKKYPIA